MTRSAGDTARRAVLAYAAAAMFLLAGVLTGVAALRTHGRVPIALGSMWLGVATLWTVVGTRLSRKAVTEGREGTRNA